MGPQHDGLALPQIGSWGKRKYHILGRYLDQFTTAMRPRWPAGLHFIDLFAGAGLAQVRESGEIVYGSPLIAATLKYPFTTMHFCDAERVNTIALGQRLAKIAPADRFTVHCGDANRIINQILEPIPKRDALSVAFADPYGLHLDFDTVRILTPIRADLIVLMADNMDALRNWATYYDRDPESSLDRFMGEPGWRDELRKTSPERQAFKLRSRYEQRLRSIGYSHFDTAPIKNSQGRDIYSLMYASRNALGGKFWRNALRIDESGQRSLF